MAQTNYKGLMLIKTGGTYDTGGIPPQPPSPPPPPHNGPMEARVDKLESDAKDGRERLSRVETKLDHVAADVGQFKWWLFGSALAIILAVIGTGVGIQQMTVATFQAAAAQASPPQQQQQQPIIINIPQPAAAPATK